MVSTEAAQGTSYQEMADYSEAGVAKLSRAIRTLRTSRPAPAAAFFGVASNQGRMSLQLKPRRQRKPASTKIIKGSGPKYPAFQACAYLSAVPPIDPFRRTPSKSGIRVHGTGAGHADLLSNRRKS